MRNPAFGMEMHRRMHHVSCYMTYLPTKAAHERLVKMLKIFSKRTEHVVKETESVRIKRLLMLGTKMSS